MPLRREAAWNPSLEPAIVPVQGVEALLASLRLPGALVVTTGQQPGLFTGPSYAVTKALSARGLAQDLAARWQVPVVPVYWVPGDDHDFEESAGAAWIGADAELRRARLPARPPDAPLIPMARLPLGPAVMDALAAFSASFTDAATRDPITEWLARHYRPEATVAGAFAAAMAELLAPFGILCLDSTHPAVKRAAAPLVLGALDAATELDADLDRLSHALAAAGRDPGVPVGDGASLAFIETPLGRDRLVLAGGGGGFRTRRSKTKFTLAELERIAREEPDRLSGNVLLRPAIESALLPTVAYVAGPGELRYLELAAPVYRRLGVYRQLPVPRWSGLVLEPRVSRILEKFGATLGELTAQGDGLETRIIRRALPEDTEGAFAQLRDSIASGFAPLIERSAQVDPVLRRPAESASGAALHAAEKLEKKLLQHGRRRQSVELAQLATARRSVRPEGRPQERVLSMAGFLARYGPGLLEDLANHVAAWYHHGLEALPPGA